MVIKLQKTKITWARTCFADLIKAMLILVLPHGVKLVVRKTGFGDEPRTAKKQTVIIKCRH